MDFYILELINGFIERYTTEVIGGLTVTIILLLFNYASKFIKNIRVSKKYSGYIGDYYLYGYSAAGVNKIVSSKLSIKTRLGKLIVIVEGTCKVYNYIGVMHITERNLYLNYKGINHIERISLIFHSPLHRVIKKLVGVTCSVSPIDEPIAKYCILSDTEIPEEEIYQRFEKLRLEQKDNILKVPRNNDLFFDNLEPININPVYKNTSKTLK